MSIIFGAVKYLNQACVFGEVYVTRLGTQYKGFKCCL
jgi:hypothetical protein